MTIVDSHVHVGLHRFEPVESLLFQLDRLGIAQAVLVHYGDGRDNDYALECVRRHPQRFVAAIALDARNDPADLARFAANGAVGVRLAPTARSRGANPWAVWEALRELRLVVSLWGVPELLLSDSAAELFERFPHVPMAIEHLGFHVTPKPSFDVFRRVMSLARYDNLTLKVPGLGEYGLTPPLALERIPRYADLALESFGPQRMMWASDFPVVSAREGYGNALSLVQRYFAALSPSERAAIFGATAARVWRLPLLTVARQRPAPTDRP